MDEKQYFIKLASCKKRILESDSQWKLIVSGPGTGKTSFFSEAIDYYGGKKNSYLVLTFINNLVDELRRDLGEKAKIFTFHGYCASLLGKNVDLRYGLQDDFEYYPPLIELIKSDWELCCRIEPPEFYKLMRNVDEKKCLEFFLTRGDYYNAVGYDDSVFRVYRSLKNGKGFKEKYKLIIVDEYQDFNLLETSVLSQIIKSSPALFVGDDDQALYRDLRESNPKFLRELFKGKDFEKFELPFCLRCPHAVISAFDKIVAVAKEKGLLSERVDKKFEFFPPIKGKDSKRYPNVKLVVTSVQKKTPADNNYFGKYIIQELLKIDPADIKTSHEGQFPTVLIIGPSHYLKIVADELDRKGCEYKFRKGDRSLKVQIKDGLMLLNKNDSSNLGWRVVLENTRPNFFSKIISISISEGKELVNLIPKRYIKKILADAKKLKKEKQEEVIEEEHIDKTKPIIQLTTFEGAKGLSAHHVFILGLQNGLFPKKADAISEIEVCKLLVALTRTRKQCNILITKNFCGKWVDPSEFIKWIEGEQIQRIEIDKDYW